MPGFILTQALISLAEGDATAGLTALGDVAQMTPPPDFPAYALVEARVLEGLALLALGDHAAARAAAEAALAAAEPDRLIFPLLSSPPTGSSRPSPGIRQRIVRW